MHCAYFVYRPTVYTFLDVHIVVPLAGDMGSV